VQLYDRWISITVKEWIENHSTPKKPLFFLLFFASDTVSQSCFPFYFIPSQVFVVYYIHGTYSITLMHKNGISCKYLGNSFCHKIDLFHKYSDQKVINVLSLLQEIMARKKRYCRKKQIYLFVTYMVMVRIILVNAILNNISVISWQ
jgi:hypothetical protein